MPMLDTGQSSFVSAHMSCIMRKAAFCIQEKKDAADQGLCFCYIYRIIPLFPKSEI